MRYALISDIHANLPALEAVLADIDGRDDVGATYHLGDLVGYAPWPNEVAALLRERGIPGIAGNYDSTVATDYEHCGCKAETPARRSSRTRATGGHERTSRPGRSGSWGRCPSGWISGQGAVTSPGRSWSWSTRRLR